MQSTNSAEQTRKRRGWPKSANWDLWEKGKRFTIRELIWLSLGFDAPAPYDDDNRRQLAAEIRSTFKERFELTRRLLVVEDSPHYFVKPPTMLLSYLCFGTSPKNSGGFCLKDSRSPRRANWKRVHGRRTGR